MNYLHESGIVHRDLKLENILVDEKLGIVVPIITDFGFAKLSVKSGGVARFVGQMAQWHLRSCVRNLMEWKWMFGPMESCYTDLSKINYHSHNPTWS